MEPLIIYAVIRSLGMSRTQFVDFWQTHDGAQKATDRRNKELKRGPYFEVYAVRVNSDDGE